MEMIQRKREVSGSERLKKSDKGSERGEAEGEVKPKEGG